MVKLNNLITYYFQAAFVTDIFIVLNCDGNIVHLCVFLGLVKRRVLA